MAGRLIRLFHTLRYLRFEQLFFQVYYRIARPLLLHWCRWRVAPAVERRPWESAWDGLRYAQPGHRENATFTYLGEVGSLVRPADWNNGSQSRLWFYHLHYLDDLGAQGAASKAADCQQLIARWIAENPPLAGTGWEPYPLSLRLVNLVKWCSENSNFPEVWVSSLAQQAQALSMQLERHILANHYFANGKALVFVGAFLSGKMADRWLKRGLRILDQEIAEQFLPDGGHCELTPMYHATLLWDVCELVKLADRSGHAALLARRQSWVGAIQRGLKWLSAMTHPDGEVAFFNDAAKGHAPRAAQLNAYAKLLGIETEQPAPKAACHHLASTGYVACEWAGGQTKLIVDVAAVGLDYQPGHAHADTLSFELSIRGKRVFVNGGTSTYEANAERLRQRGTAAHNTLVLDGVDSSEVWSGFRVARRARVCDVAVENAVAERYRIAASHDGYSRLSGKSVHRRDWCLTPGRLEIHDQVTAYTDHQAIIYFHVEPTWQAVLRDGATVDLVDNVSGQPVCRVESLGGAELRVTPFRWCPRFGEQVKAHSIELHFPVGEGDLSHTTRITWKNP
ncbi:heparinase II/III family protein [Litorivivens sp.]|uniref:heparinase II/III family protein n=1 Tax=Litorivivens sp. TaxID=2020868 RepID=UPI00356B287E